jgi:predicted dehydrogenase
MINVGLIGYGYWGKIIHSKLKLISDVKFICRSKDTYVDKLDSVDWVFVVTPDNTHYRITKTCLEHGKNVFCEKPFTCNVGQAIKLYKLAEKYNVKLYVDDVFRYRTQLKELHSVIDKEKKLKVVWNTLKSENYLNRLTWHHLYMLYPILNGQLDIDWPRINNITFEYGVTDKKYHEVAGIDFTHITDNTDALLNMINGVLNHPKLIDWTYNSNTTIHSERILGMIKDNINRSNK